MPATLLPTSPMMLLGKIVSLGDDLRRAVETGDADAVLSEAADVANFAMMIADSVAALENKEVA